MKWTTSPLILGTWAFAGGEIWGKQDWDHSREMVETALDLGLTAFDSAPGYGSGESERVLGKALKGSRDKAQIATKVSRGNLDREGVARSCEESLRRLQTDHIDLLQVHWPSLEIPFEETVQAFARLKEEGKVRHIGVCNFGPRDMQAWFANGGEMETNQLPYSLLSRAIEFEVVPECVSRHVAVLPYSPLMQGLLTGKFSSPDEVPPGRARSRHFSPEREQARHGEPGCEEATFRAIGRIADIARESGKPMDALSLAWLLAKPYVGGVIVGARTGQQVKDNAVALKIDLSAPVLERLDEATAEVKHLLGANPDLWESPGRFDWARKER